MTELLGKVVGWTVKTMFGIVVGFPSDPGAGTSTGGCHENAAVMRAVEAVPGSAQGPEWFLIFFWDRRS